MPKPKRHRHGLARSSPQDPGRHPLYNRWVAIRQRCRSKRHPRYPDYGGRGIFICARWDDFAVFVADMGEPPGGDYASYSIDRINVDGPYAPWNCRWATAAEQAANKRCGPNAAQRRYEYGQPWPFGVLQEDKVDGLAAYAHQMVRELAAGTYTPDPREAAWLDKNWPTWRA